MKALNWTFITLLAITTVRAVWATPGDDPYPPVPLSVSSGHKLVTLPCTIGEASGTCILDTGATVSSIADSPAFSKYRVVYQTTSTSQNSTYSTPVVEVDRFSLGQLVHAKNIFTMKLATYGGENFFGVAAADFFQAGLVLDFAKALHSQSAIVYPNKDVLNRLNRLPKAKRIRDFVFEVRVGGKTLSALIDTGSESSMFSDRYVKANPNEFHEVGATAFRDAAGNVSQNKIYIYAGPAINMAGQTFDPYAISASTFAYGDVDLILGMDVIQGLSWYLTEDLKSYSVFKDLKN